MDSSSVAKSKIANLTELIAFDLVKYSSPGYIAITQKGKNFLEWYILEKETNKDI